MKEGERELTSDNAVDGNVNGRGVARRVAEEVDVGAAELADLREAGHAAVVPELLVPVGLAGHPVGHGGVDEARGDGVDADAVGGPLHGQGVRHVAHAGLGGAVGG